MGIFTFQNWVSGGSSHQNVVYSLTLGIGIGALGLSVIYWNKRHSKDSWIQVGSVDRISLYPIKGLKGFQIDDSPQNPEVHLTKFGLKCGNLRDRCFALGSCKNSQGTFEFVTMLSVPKLVLIDVRVSDSFGSVTLSAEGMEEIIVQFPSKTNEQVKLEVWKADTVGTRCDEGVNEWFRRFLGRDDVFLVSAIVKQDIETVNVRNPVKDPKYGKYAPEDMRVIFNDSTPVMMISDLSHQDVNDNLTSKGRPPVGIDSWKSNIVLRCNPDQVAFCEDNWGRVVLGDVGGDDDIVMERVRLCNRCAVTKVDPKTGTFRRDEEPLRTMRTYRMHPAFKSPIFGSLLHVSTPGIISIGTPVYAVEEKFSPK